MPASNKSTPGPVTGSDKTHPVQTAGRGQLQVLGTIKLPVNTTDLGKLLIQFDRVAKRQGKTAYMRGSGEWIEIVVTP